MESIHRLDPVHKSRSIGRLEKGSTSDKCIDASTTAKLGCFRIDPSVDLYPEIQGLRLADFIELSDFIENGLSE